MWENPKQSQLFGEPDADEDVSPDTEDPDIYSSSVEPHQPINRVSTREWVSSCNYHPDKLFQKFFIDDITYLLTMDKLWQTRHATVPLDDQALPVEDMSSEDTELLLNQRLWSLQVCVSTFKQW